MRLSRWYWQSGSKVARAGYALIIMSLMSSCGGSGGGGSGGTPPPGSNQAPVATNSCVSTPVNTGKTDKLPATDPEGQALTYEILQLPIKGSLSTDGAGNYTYLPNSNARGMDKFTFRAKDSQGRESNTAVVYMLIGGAVRVMPLGDSITLGSFTATTPAPNESIGYRRRLYNDLVALSNGRFGIDFVGSLSNGASANPPVGDPNHEGHGGFTDGQVASNITTWLNDHPADIILLHIGTNDFNTNASDVEAILNNISAWENANYPASTFVARIIKTANNSLDVTTFNNNVAAMVAARGNNRLFMVDQENGAGLDYRVGVDMSDNLHPNQSGYDKIAQKWRADIQSAAILPSCP